MNANGDDALKDAAERQDFSADEKAREDGMNQLRSGFMKPCVYFGTYVTIETTAGTETVPVDAVPAGVSLFMAENFKDQCEGRIIAPDEQLEIESGWLARMSAPGYTDCTSWTAHKTQAEAEQDLIDNYSED